MTNGYFWNRISGRFIKMVPEKYLLGQYQVSPGHLTFINNVSSLDYDYFVPDNSNESRVIIPGLSVDKKFKYVRKILTDQLTENAVREISHTLYDLLAICWSDILEISPLVPKISERVNIQNFERIIESKLSHLLEVCHRPATLLSTEIQTVHVSTAIRIPKLATEYLLSHTEDWEKRTIHAIQPKKVLSELITDEYIIYENKVAVRLVDHLRSYLFKRILEVQKLYSMISETNYSLESHNWEKHAFRVYDLWGESLESGIEEKAKATLDKLKAMYYKLGGLMDSKLYKKVPMTANVEPSLLDTNILTNHQDYRQVSQLWREWYKINKIQRLTGKELYKEKQEAYKGFNHFCWILIVRALSQLELRPENVDIPIQKDIKLLGRRTDIRLCRLDDHTFEIHLTAHEKKIRFVSIFSNIINLTTNNDFDEYMRIFESDVEKAQCKTIILYPDQNIAGIDNNRLIRINSLFLRSEENNTSYGIIPVSPFSLFSVEKVGRSIRQFIDGILIESYPPAFDIDNSLISDMISDNSGWVISNRNNDGILITAPPQKDDIEQLRRHISSEIKKVKVMGKVFQYKVHVFNHFLGQIDTISQCYSEILTCPICHKQQPPESFTKRYMDNHTFTCRCTECNIEWGLNSCANCGDNFPFINLNTIFNHDQHEIGWVDKIFGLDLVASPCSSKGEKMHFRCTKCNYCSIHNSTRCLMKESWT